jgi:hypothetical protein
MGLYFKTTRMGIKRFCVRLWAASDLCVGTTLLNRSLEIAPSTLFVHICLVPRHVFYLWHYCLALGSWPVCFMCVQFVGGAGWLHSCLFEYCSWQEDEYRDIHVWKGCKGTYCVVMKRSKTRKYRVMSGQGIVITLTRYCDKTYWNYGFINRYLIMAQAQW